MQASALAGVKPDSSALHATTLKLHERIIDEFNLTALEKLPPDELAKQVRAYIADHLRRESLSLNQKELDLFPNEIIASLWSLEPLLKDPKVTDVLINTHKRCFIALRTIAGDQGSTSRMRRTSCTSSTGSSRRSDGGVDESSPMVDARLRDASRVNVPVRPIAGDGPLVSIRKFARARSRHGPASRKG